MTAPYRHCGGSILDARNVEIPLEDAISLAVIWTGFAAAALEGGHDETAAIFMADATSLNEASTQALRWLRAGRAA